MLVSLKDYAKLHGKAVSTVQQMARLGGFETAQLIGKVYVIDSEEPYPDRRVKSGKYKDWRKKDETPDDN